MEILKWGLRCEQDSKDCPMSLKFRIWVWLASSSKLLWNCCDEMHNAVMISGDNDNEEDIMEKSELVHVSL